jgi:hypothetical protein
MNFYRQMAYINKKILEQQQSEEYLGRAARLIHRTSKAKLKVNAYEVSFAKAKLIGGIILCLQYYWLTMRFGPWKE